MHNDKETARNGTYPASVFGHSHHNAGGFPATAPSDVLHQRNSEELAVLLVDLILDRGLRSAEGRGQGQVGETLLFSKNVMLKFSANFTGD